MWKRQKVPEAEKRGWKHLNIASVHYMIKNTVTQADVGHNMLKKESISWTSIFDLIMILAKYICDHGQGGQNTINNKIALPFLFQLPSHEIINDQHKNLWGTFMIVFRSHSLILCSLINKDWERSAASSNSIWF